MSLIAPEPTETTKPGPLAKPIEDVQPVVRESGLVADIAALFRYMAGTEVHTYAFSVAAKSSSRSFPSSFCCSPSAATSSTPARWRRSSAT